MKLRLGKTDLLIGYETVAAVTAVLLLDRDSRVICCILAALLHESGHLLMMKRFRVPVSRIRLRVFDIEIKAGDFPSPRSEALVTLAGPAMNLLCFAVTAPFSAKLSMPHLALGLFNALPVMSLDGGRMLEIFLQKKYSPLICSRVLHITTFIVILPLMTGGIFLLLKSGYNYSLLAISLYLTAVLFLKK